MTCAPWLRKALAKAPPIPPVPPVIKTCFPATLKSGVFAISLPIKNRQKCTKSRNERSSASQMQYFSPLLSSLTVLLVADLLHPIDDLPIELFLNGDMRHGRCRRSAMPVLFRRREPHHIARPNFLDWTALTLRPAAAGRDKQGLA